MFCWNLREYIFLLFTAALPVNWLKKSKLGLLNKQRNQQRCFATCVSGPWWSPPPAPTPRQAAAGCRLEIEGSPSPPSALCSPCRTPTPWQEETHNTNTTGKVSCWKAFNVKHLQEVLSLTVAWHQKIKPVNREPTPVNRWVFVRRGSVT